MIDRDKYTIQQPSTYNKACKYPAAIDIRTPTKSAQPISPSSQKTTRQQDVSQITQKKVQK